MATEKPRFSVTFTDESFNKIQKYQKENNISTQSKAVARLVEIAINDIEATLGTKKAPLYSSEAERLAQDYDSLDDHGKRIVRLVVNEERSRCSEQAQATSTTKLYIAARDGARMEVEMDGDITLPDEDSQLRQ